MVLEGTERDGRLEGRREGVPGSRSRLVVSRVNEEYNGATHLIRLLRHSI